MYWQKDMEKDGRQQNWWLEVTRDVERYINGYDICQRIKNQTEVPVEKLMVNNILEKLWTHLIVDFITKLLLGKI